jgi:1-phosphofructokinase
MILTVTANPSLDRTYRIDGKIELGEVNRAGSEDVEASGKGVNVSRALHAAGLATTCVLPLGGAEGEQLRRLIAADGLAYRAVEVTGPTRTNTTLADAGGRTTKVNAPGHALPAAAADALVALVGLLAGDARWVVCSGSLPPGTPPELVGRLVRAARAGGARTAVDASGEALAAAAVAGPDLIAPNADELGRLVGRTLPGHGQALIEAAADAAAALAASTGTSLLVSLGADGALWVPAGHPADRLHGRPPRVEPVNTAGAGDALLAGWLAADAGPAAADDLVGATARLAQAVAWGTAACLMPTTSGDVAATADVGTVTVSRIPSQLA